ncbi:MAG: TerB N-terminal domain-containing protein [Lactimicrobium sp.]|jgi:hypothetical protein|uniref:TerB N-terminal domain-containing protein n=1 Tax=Lactimicrobium sp. TaxID=2563780 RepID=UPI002F35A6EC
MEMKELAVYAEKKYRCQIRFSGRKSMLLLVDPVERQCVGLLMRDMDRETGEITEYGDIRCPQSALKDVHDPAVGLPYHMKQNSWIGIRFDDGIDADLVFSLFDQAMQSLKTRGYTIVLDEHPAPEQYQASSIPFAHGVHQEKVPARILDMMQSYQYGDGSFSWKCRSFLRQGKMMADYEDHVPWDGEIQLYFPTYHDLTPAQLRGYFTWRTMVRKGDYQKTNAAFVYLYVYELLNQIGTSSPADSISHLQAFQENYVNVHGDARMKQLVSQWMLGFAVVKRLPLAVVQSCLDAESIQQGKDLSVLKEPEDDKEKEIASALLKYSRYRSFDTAVYKDRKEEALSLLGKMWITAEKMYHNEKGQDLFTAIFGEKQKVSWKPLLSAVYDGRRDSREDVSYQLNACERVFCQNGNWIKEKYTLAGFDKKLLVSFVRASDRQIRLYLQLPHPLPAKSEGDWALPYIKAAIAQKEQERMQAKRDAVKIHFGSLAEIRRDAMTTQESLMTDEERMEDAVFEINETMIRQETEPEKPETETVSEESSNSLLNAQQVKILSLLVENKPVDDVIVSMHGMPEVIADEINEALFDEIGDAAVTCIDGKLALQEDYRDDVIAILKGE